MGLNVRNRIYGGVRAYRPCVFALLGFDKRREPAMSNSEKTREHWMVLAELAAREQDPNKLLDTEKAELVSYQLRYGVQCLEVGS